jgi:sec-independent protein translocase protein TatC
MSKGHHNQTFKTMSLGDHLEELRWRLILALLGLVGGLVICLFFGGRLLQFISSPYAVAMEKANLQPVLLAIQPAEKFLVYFKTSLLFGLILSSPWVFYQLWAFVSAGLYPKEKRYVHRIVPISVLLFIAGAFFFIKVVAPMAMLFFISFNPGIDFVEVNFTLQNYVSFVVSLTIVFGFAFQMPIVVVCLEKLGIITLTGLREYRKYVILLLTIICALVTPPDVISQIALAVPLYSLYEVSILICRITRKKTV